MSNGRIRLPLEHHFEARQKAIEWQNKASQRQSDETIKIADEKVQYFEKLAFGTGATLAVIISFVGAHPSDIHTPRTLQSAALLLVIAFFSAMARNWCFPFYKMRVWIRHKIKADQTVEDIEAALFRDYPTVPVLDNDNKPIPPDAFLTDYDRRTKQRSDAVTQTQRQEDLRFRLVVALESISVVSIIAAGILLVVAVWLTVGFHAPPQPSKPVLVAPVVQPH